MFIKIFFCLIDHNLFITILEKSSGRNKEEFHSLPENVWGCKRKGLGGKCITITSTKNSIIF